MITHTDMYLKGNWLSPLIPILQEKVSQCIYKLLTAVSPYWGLVSMVYMYQEHWQISPKNSKMQEMALGHVGSALNITEHIFHLVIYMIMHIDMYIF
jgi:hypothetical protein